MGQQNIKKTTKKKKPKKKELMQNCGQCDRGPSKPEETTQFVCNKKEMGFAPKKLT